MIGFDTARAVQLPSLCKICEPEPEYIDQDFTDLG